MKEGMSMTTIFQIVILFILLFAGIMALTINNSNAFAVKNSVLNAIEENNGLVFEKGTDKLRSNIIDAIQEASYRTNGRCDEGYTGYDRNGDKSDDDYAAICIKEVNVTEKTNSDIPSTLHYAEDVDLVGKYYKIQVFYQLDLPVIKQAFNFNTKGETRIIYSADNR